MSIQNGTTRQDVFVALIQDDRGWTPKEIGDEIDETRQAVDYHLDKLEEMGLVVHDSEEYRAQPVFTDEEFKQEFVDSIATLLPKLEDRIVHDDRTDGAAQTTVLFNCMRMFVALELLDAPEGQKTP